jgi:hypothetical protein
MRDLHTTAEIVIPPALIDDMPPFDGEIVYSGEFNAAGLLVGRLVPLYTLGTEARTSAAAFAPRTDATALFLARYMPYSRAFLLAMLGETYPTAVEAVLHNAPGLLFVFGYIDTQGVQQALRDFDPTSPYVSAAPSWWQRLFVTAASVQTACTASGCNQLAPTPSTESTLAALEALRIVTRNNGHLTMWTTHISAMLAMVYDLYATDGRVGGPETMFAPALHAYDMLFWRTDPAARALRTTAAGWFEPPATMHDIGSMVHAAVARLAAALPVVVFNDIEQWSPINLAYALSTLLLSVPQTRNADERFITTGSGVPIKIVFLYRTNRCRVDARLTPQQKPLIAEHKTPAP